MCVSVTFQVSQGWLYSIGACVCVRGTHPVGVVLWASAPGLQLLIGRCCSLPPSLLVLPPQQLDTVHTAADTHTHTESVLETVIKDIMNRFLVQGCDDQSPSSLLQAPWSSAVQHGRPLAGSHSKPTNHTLDLRLNQPMGALTPHVSNCVFWHGGVEV